MKSLLLREGSDILKVSYDIVGDQLWFHCRGETFVVPLNEPKKRRHGAGDTGSAGNILAPMPGKITQVNCRTGDAIESGRVLIVMEAMKMEYSLKAGISGIVEEIAVKVGDQVQLGQTLVNVKAME